MRRRRPRTRHLVWVLGDQLDATSAAFDGFDPAQDAVLMVEARRAATYIPQHRAKLVLFFSAMRHFAAEQEAPGRLVHYSRLDAPGNHGTLTGAARRAMGKLGAERLIVVAPGNWRLEQSIYALQVPLEVREDRHFLCSRSAYLNFTRTHQRPILETFYRWMRQRTGVLMDAGGKPTGGAWNFDKENRRPLPRQGGPPLPAIPAFTPDATTRDVMRLVVRAFPDAPGRLDHFALPVTRAEALHALDDFVRHRLASFGPYQDAMLSGEAVLFHSALSTALNQHLLSPREVVDAVVPNPAGAPLNSVEGYVRQIIGWREFAHGTYWRHMPRYAAMNALDADLPMPRFYWTGETDMRCMAESIRHTIDHAYAHHIERLMVLGLFALLLGVRPYDVHRWHMSMFRDSVDWVSLPNALGMGQHADGGIMGTKPYIASGNYINKMSDYCGKCRYDPRKTVGDDACPFSTLYYDFLDRHKTRFARNARMRTQYLNLARKSVAEMKAIRRRAELIKSQATATTFLSPEPVVPVGS